MQSTLFNMEEVVSRKDYLKNKENEKKQRQRKNKNENKKPSYYKLAFVVILTGYVIFQFSTYQKKYNLVNNVPQEISSLKNYDIYYTTSTYTYDPEIVLNHTKSNTSVKEVISSVKGITNISGEGGYVYGMKEDTLVRIKNENNSSKTSVSNFGKLETVMDKGVRGYFVYKDEVYVFIQGKDVGTGIYTKAKDSDKYVRIIDIEVSQLLADENNIYIVGIGEDKNIYSYSKDGSNRKQLTQNRSAKYIIEDETAIYFSDDKSDGKLYSINKSSLEEKSITTGGAIKLVNNDVLNGGFCMGIYDGYIYYINANKENKLFKAKIDGREEEKEVIGSSIEKISMIGYSVIYKEKDGKSIYRFEIKNGVSSELTSGRIIDFSASAGIN